MKDKTKLPKVVSVCGTDWEVREGTFDPEDADTVGHTDMRAQVVCARDASLQGRVVRSCFGAPRSRGTSCSRTTADTTRLR